MRAEDLLDISVEVPDIKKLIALYKLTFFLAPTLDIDEILERIVKIAIAKLPVERCVVVLLDGKNTYREKNYNIKSDKKRDISRSVIEKVIKECKPVLIDNALEDREFGKRDSIRKLSIKSICAVPITYGNELLGVIYVDNRALARGFSKADCNFLQAIGNLVSPLLWNAREYETSRINLDPLIERISPGCRFGQLIGKSKRMRQIFSLLEDVKDTRCPVLVTGEPGTGKDLLARCLYEASTVCRKGFFKVELEDIPSESIHSILFDPENGVISLSSGGTVLINNIELLPLDCQSKLLKLLEDSCGENSRKHPHETIRIIATSAKNLEEEVQKGNFKASLFYKLSVVHIRIPPLRERKEDLPLLASHFLNKFNQRYGKEIKGFTKAALSCMKVYSWPGNVRELESRIEKAVLRTSSNSYLTAEALELHVDGEPNELKSLEEREIEHILDVLNSVGWNKKKAAEILGISRRTLYNKLKKYGIG